MNTRQEIVSHYRGMRDGVTRFAHWKDGVQYVGTTGKTLAAALDELRLEEQRAYKRILRDEINNTIKWTIS